VYPFSSHSTIPAKVSVSKLYPELLNETDNFSDIIKKAESLETKRPRFMGGESDAAEKGTATHLFLQFCDFSKLKPNNTSIKEEIARLVEKKFIPSNITELIRTEEIVKFVSSDFYQSILKSKELFREFRFNVFLPAKDFTDDPTNKETLDKEEILVQGVIDLCFIDENNRLILCDYKTDRIPHELKNDKTAVSSFFADRHSEQLKYYAKAIERIMGKNPDAVLIYSLCFGETFEISL
jgi:ATP-dependent helicase/nuclease subunit A